MEKNKKIRKTSAPDLVCERIQEMIAQGSWSYDQKIPSENELASMMGVSRVSIRSALQKLSSVGLIESRHGEGTFVSKLDGGQVMNMLLPVAVLTYDNQKYMVEFRRVIESEQAYLAALRITNEELNLLKENYKKMQKVDSLSQACSELDVEFHMLVAKASKNPMFIQTSNILKDTILDNILYVRKYTEENQAFTYHRRIIDALEQRDALAAKEAMYEHLERLWELIQEDS